MDIQTLKLDLVQKIIHTEKESLLFKISKIFEKEKSEDWWDQLPGEVQNSIYEGLSNLEEGKIFTDEQVMQEAKLRYGL